MSLSVQDPDADPDAGADPEADPVAGADPEADPDFTFDVVAGAA